LHFCARSSPVGVGNADCPPDYTCRRWQRNHPSPWLGSSSWLGPSSLGPSSWLGPSSPLVKPHCLMVIFLEEAASVWRLFHLREATSATAPRKSRQGFPRRPVPLRCVCQEVCSAERCSNVAQACLATGRNAFMEWGIPMRCQLCRGQRIPDDL
jgi:hypothetical protein